MLKRKPYLLFFIFGLILLMHYFFTSTNRVLDINFQDTYYVVSKEHLLIFGLEFTSVLGLVYFILDWFKAPMILQLSKIHIYGTLLLLCIFSLFHEMQTCISSERYYVI